MMMTPETTYVAVQHTAENGAVQHRLSAGAMIVQATAGFVGR
jgi:hypothetical protein